MPQVELSQGVIDYADEGRGRTLLLVHGIFADRRLWDAVAGPLSRRFRVIAPTWPLGGHKRAMRRDADLSTLGVARMIADFQAALDLSDVVLVGNDTGGAFAHVSATRHPERVGALVLNSCDLEENFLPAMFANLPRMMGTPGVTWALAQALRFAPLQRLPTTFGWLSHRAVEPALVRDWTSGLRASAALRRDARKAVQGIDSRLTVQAAKDLASFDCPTLWAWGADDRFFPVEQARRIAATMANARFEVIAGSRTYTPVDQPEALVRLIAEFADM